MGFSTLGFSIIFIQEAEDDEAVKTIKITVRTWVQEGRQDVGIAVELNTLLCHQTAIFLSPMLQKPFGSLRDITVLVHTQKYSRNFIVLCCSVL